MSPELRRSSVLTRMPRRLAAVTSPRATLFLVPKENMAELRGVDTNPVALPESGGGEVGEAGVDLLVQPSPAAPNGLALSP